MLILRRQSQAGVNPYHFRYNRKKRDTFRRTYDQGRLTILAVGQVILKKSVEILPKVARGRCLRCFSLPTVQQFVLQHNLAQAGGVLVTIRL